MEIMTNRNEMGFNVQVTLYERVGNSIDIYSFGKDGQMVATRKKIEDCEGSCVKPTMIMREDIFRGFIDAVLKLSKNQGIKDTSLSHAEGKLEATEKHLEDMRKLVFK